MQGLASFVDFLYEAYVENPGQTFDFSRLETMEGASPLVDAFIPWFTSIRCEKHKKPLIHSSANLGRRITRTKRKLSDMEKSLLLAMSRKFSDVAQSLRSMFGQR